MMDDEVNDAKKSRGSHNVSNKIERSASSEKKAESTSGTRSWKEDWRKESRE
jgi:hypothetical protein